MTAKSGGQVCGDCGGAWALVVETGNVGVDGAHDAAADLVQLPRLSVGQRVEDEAAYFRDVAGRGYDHLGQAFAGEDGEGVATVGGVGGAAYPAALLQPADYLRQAR